MPSYEGIFDLSLMEVEIKLDLGFNSSIYEVLMLCMTCFLVGVAENNTFTGRCAFGDQYFEIF